MLIFFVGGQLTGDVALFTFVIECLFSLVGIDTEEEIESALISMYCEYNAPLSEKLTKAINNIS